MAVEYYGNKNDDGLSLGQAASDLISFYGVTPVAQAATIAAATNTTTTTSTTTALTTDLDSVRTKLNSVITALKNIGVIAAA
jgi:hypothetical protein